MGKAFEEIRAGLEEAIAYMDGKDIGATVHHVRVADIDVRAMRKKLGMTQDDFAGVFCVSVGTVRNWEQRRRRPEGPAKALLQVIAKEPDAVRRALG